MGKKHIKLLLVIMLIALVMASFSACGLLKPKTIEVSEVSIDITSGLTKEGNTYYAYVGDDVVFTKFVSDTIDLPLLLILYVNSF